MGSCLSSITALILKEKFDKKMKMLMIGLDGAGKTTILYKMKLSEFVIHTVPTIGFNVEEVEYTNLKMTIWDIGGQASIRKLWNYYYEETRAVIFVVDCSDTQRLELAKEEMRNTMFDTALFGAKLLVFANKMDIACKPVKELADKLDLNELHVDWHLQGTTAVTGEGLHEGFEWLSNAMDDKRRRL